MIPSNRPCPVCGSTEPKKLHRQEFCEGFLGLGYDVVTCRVCGAGYADGVPHQSVLDKYYAEQSKYVASAATESEYDFRRFRLIADHIKSLGLTDSARILDIGCATGGLLSVLRDRGFENVFGMDPSQDCADQAQRLHGIHVRASAISSIADWSERFDLILLIGVLEHLREAASSLIVIAGLLNPGGKIYIGVPDADGFARCRNAPFQQFSMEHVNFFTEGSLRNLAGRARMTISSIWKQTIEWRKNVDEPILSMELVRAEGHSSIQKDLLSEAALINYLKQSKIWDREIDAKIKIAAALHTSILIWGAGALARRLLASGSMRPLRIVAFVDSNARLQGQSLAGYPVIDPSQAAARPEPILVCSVAFAEEIVSLIRGIVGPARVIYRLDDVSAPT